MAGFLFTTTTLALGAGDNNTTISLALGTTSLVEVTLSSTPINLVGLAAVGGNVDGMVVCFCNVSASANTLFFVHDSGLPTPINRFRNSGSTNKFALQFGTSWYRYSSVTTCWQQMLRA